MLPLSITHGAELGAAIFKDMSYRIGGIVTSYQSAFIDAEVLLGQYSPAIMDSAWHSHPNHGSLGPSGPDNLFSANVGIGREYRGYSHVRFYTSFRNSTGSHTERF